MLTGADEGAAPAPAGLSLTDIEERLNGPDGKAVASALEASLRGAQARVRSAIAGGLRPEAFAKARDISAGLEAAERVLAAIQRKQA